MASSKASKAKRRVSVEDIPIMQPFTDSVNVDSDGDEEFEEEHPVKDSEKILEEEDAYPMEKRMILIEK